AAIWATGKIFTEELLGQGRPRSTSTAGRNGRRVLFTVPAVISALQSTLLVGGWRRRRADGGGRGGDIARSERGNRHPRGVVPGGSYDFWPRLAVFTGEAKVLHLGPEVVTATDAVSEAEFQLLFDAGMLYQAYGYGFPMNQSGFSFNIPGMPVGQQQHPQAEMPAQEEQPMQGQLSEQQVAYQQQLYQWQQAQAAQAAQYQQPYDAYQQQLYQQQLYQQ
ncbi:unnamed protein product, partial [Symbiodinium sp. KB8]